MEGQKKIEMREGERGKGRGRNRGRESERQSLSFFPQIHSPKCPQWLGLDQAEPRSQKLNPELPRGWLEPICLPTIITVASLEAGVKSRAKNCAWVL